MATGASTLSSKRACSLARQSEVPQGCRPTRGAPSHTPFYSLSSLCAGRQCFEWRGCKEQLARQIGKLCNDRVAIRPEEHFHVGRRSRLTEGTIDDSPPGKVLHALRHKCYS